MKTHAFPLFVSSVLVLLFGYTAFSKLLTLSAFEDDLSRIPFISGGASVLAPAIPMTELVIMLLLLFPATWLKGLYFSAGLLSVFTAYLIGMLLLAPEVPCSCGGVISGMGWWEHVGMNAGFIGLAVAGLKRGCKVRS